MYLHKLLSQAVLGQNMDTWVTSLSNEFGRLADGVGERMPEGTKTIKFIPRSAVPQGRKFSYGSMVYDIRPQKAEVHRVRLTVRGDKVEYPGDISTPTINLTIAKLLVNSVLSMPNAKGLCVDIKYYYLNTEMKRFEYIEVKLEIIPQEIINQYKSTSIDHERWICIETRKGTYVLPQTGRLVNDELKAHLATYRYYPT